MLFKEFNRHFVTYFIAATITMGIFFFLRIEKSELIHIFSKEDISNIIEFGVIKYRFIIILISSFIISFLLSLIDVYLIHMWAERVKVWKRFIINLFLNIFIFFFAIRFIFRVINFISFIFVGVSTNGLSKQDFNFAIFLIIITVTIGRFFIEIQKKLGPKNFLRMLSGKFYKPREVSRIFLFIDLKDSTEISEKLGHYRYSELLSECFFDFSIVDKYNGEIYQYVGDEMVVSWEEKIGVKKENALRGAFALKEVLEKRKDYYLEKYGVFPFFKIGMHSGKIIVTEVGRIKKDITYHGTVLNLTSRIEKQCNNFNAWLLISEQFFNKIPRKKIKHQLVGKIPLKGVSKTTNIYKIEAYYENN